MAKITDSVDAILEIAQGTTAFPSVQILGSPQNSKISGFEMPANVDSIVNFKLSVPTDLDALPNAKIRIYMMTLSTNTTDNVRFIVSSHFTTSGSTVNVSFTDEPAVDTLVANADKSLLILDVALTNTPLNGQFMTGQITRNGNNVNDDVQAILLVKVQLLVDVDVT